ncbi:tektin-3-like isoform X2 [Thrips palmi]|uniref:Tektin n=1 Tax=Thrips palmi TaxID=161013 RepID=A0A6P8ZLW2_THRPL|nr:tektin-3-like isoform X2 [Thrips palmi]
MCGLQGLSYKLSPYHEDVKAQVCRPSLPVTNALVDPCYTPCGMATEPLRFPNLVTGNARNPQHAARAALYTRYTPFEWANSSLNQYNEADTNRNFSERLRCEAMRVMKETEEKTAVAQRESGRRLGERITDTTFWRNEVATELENMLAETSRLQDTRRALEKAIQDCEPPLHIAQENLYHREGRQGIDLVHDQVEQSLLSEVEQLRSCQCRLKHLHQRVCDQLRCNRAAQQELELDVKSKESALGIDNVAHQLSNFSRGINYYGGIEKYDNTLTSPDSWAENSNRNCQRSQNERIKSAQLRADADNLINTCSNEIWNAWGSTNNSFSRRVAETLEAKGKLQMHLHKVQKEIFDEEKNIEMLRKAILDKSKPLKVAHTRLEGRSHRRAVELCKDDAYNALVHEVHDLEHSLNQLHRKLEEAEAQHQQLLYTQSNLESDLRLKVNSLFIDREKCMGMRRSFPINATIKY